MSGSASWSHFSVDRRSPSDCRVTFDHRPLNTITARTVDELAELVGLIEQDPDLNAPGASSCRPVTCGSPRARTRSSASSRSAARRPGSPGLVGLARALEILLVGDDLDGPRAERYGYVNRVIADDRLNDEVDAIATRLAHLDHEAIARGKAHVG